MDYWTKRNGELVDRRYVRRRLVQRLRGCEYRDAAVAATVDNDEWLKGRSYQLVECVVDDAIIDGLRAWAEA